MVQTGKTYLDGVSPYEPGRPIEEVKREHGLEKVVKLASNENPFPPCPEAVKAIREYAPDVNRYPDGGCFYLREALSRKLDLAADRFIFGNGSDEIIILALSAFISPGDNVIISSPTFMVYEIASRVRGAEVTAVPSKDYRYDLDGMLAALSGKTKAIFIANPDNPTGTHITGPEMHSFIEAVPEDVIVFLDEAYYEFAAGEDYPDSLEYLRRGKKNVIVSRTFSKAYGLAGLRVGYAVADKDTACILNKVREPFNVNLLAQKAALAALKDHGYMNRCLDSVKAEKERFYSFFGSIGLSFVRSSTNFILVNTGMDSTEIFRMMMKKGVIIRDMASWGMKGHIRVNAGTEEENDLFFKCFKETVEDIRRGKRLA